jgi:hypothetical protein
VVVVATQARSGELALRRLPAVLLDLHAERGTGRLQLRRGRIAKSIDLADGEPVSATSTNRDETLGHFLVSAGVINEAQHRQAVATAAERQCRIGAALVALGYLTPDRLVQELTNQTRHKLVLALRWPQGAWRFDPVPPEKTVDGLRLSMVDVVLAGLRDTAGSSPEDIEALRRLDGQAFELTERGRALRADLAFVFGAEPIAALVDRGAIADIERAAGDPLRGRRLVEALLACDAATPRAAGIGLGARRAPASAPPRSPTPPPVTGNLFDLLFGEDHSHGLSGSIPLELPDAEPDSGVFDGADIASALRTTDESTAARRQLLTEYLRIQGADHYAVLMVAAKASAASLAAALTERRTAFDKTYFARFATPDDLTKLDLIHAAYDRARQTLLDDHRRAAYDRELAGGELAEAPSLAAEMSYRKAEDLMRSQRYAAALPMLEAVVRDSPSQADYHAQLGWCRWCASRKDGAAADHARLALDAALRIDADHAAAHDYKGRIAAVLGVDPSQAAFHLERAVELEPARAEALALLEQQMLARGELRHLERLYKRLIYKVASAGTDAGGRGAAASRATELALWMRLATHYDRHLDDPAAAEVALNNARRLGATDVALPRTEALAAAATSAPLREAGQRWNDARSETAGVQLVSLAEASGELDVAFLAASTMVALEMADPSAAALYDEHRPREVPRARGKLEATHWDQLRHPEDSVEIGELIELLAPAIQTLAPMTLLDLDVDPSQLVGDAEMPTAFARLRAAFAVELTVEAAPVYARPDLGEQVHVAAVATPVLLAGDDALTAPERPPLAFALGRAMTLLWPGRALGASRPARVLKAAVMAAFRDASGTDVGADQPLAAAADQAFRALEQAHRRTARGAVLRLVARQPQLNLSRWSRALLRTADRAGLLLAGDVPAALAGARAAGADGEDLVAFATSDGHRALRAALGLAR